jgi:pantothenate kinase
LVGLDGWHLTHAQLDAFPDPKLAHDRRGIHWSFDAHAYTAFVLALRQPLHDYQPDTTLAAPSFDHALKDPSPAAIPIHPFHRIVVIEGLYTFLSIEPWKTAGQLLDERWFLQINPTQATDRLVKRHVTSGVAKDLDEAIWRAKENGEYIPPPPRFHLLIQNKTNNRKINK